MLNNEALLLEKALCEICPQRQAYLIVAHDMAHLLSQREGISVSRRQIIAVAVILYTTCGQIGMEMVRLLEACRYVPSYRRAILELIYALEDDPEDKDVQLLRDALLLAECILYPVQVKSLKKQLASATAKGILVNYAITD